MDIGCYPITMSRFLFGEEPRRISALMELDPDFGTDRLTSALLDFPSGQATFTSSTQLVPYQRMHVFGTKGRLEVVIPWNAPADETTQLIIDIGGDLSGKGQRIETIPACDQYTIQGELFSRAVLDGVDVAVPLEESYRNMLVIDAVLQSGTSGAVVFLAD